MVGVLDPNTLPKSDLSTVQLAAYMDLFPKGCHKGQVILDFCNTLGVSIEQCACFGDSNNDLTMLTYIKNSIAMGNASPASLKGLVSYVTTNASNDGILNALKHFKFIG